ncbi:MAG: hypothetical protein H6923_05625 [Alphaproteobacteria bacterium]|nr:hypothetical protein [Alphaproteobacteria bacterium]
MRRFALLLSAALLSAGTACAEQAAEGLLAPGRYELVARRASSLTPAPLADADMMAALPMRSITVGEDNSLAFLDEMSCADMEVERVWDEPAVLADPMLSDLALDPPYAVPAVDARIGCPGATKHAVLAIDENVLLVPSANGTRYDLFERPIDEASLRELQDALRRLGHEAVVASGTLDAASLAALAEEAERAGADYRFARPALTRALRRAVFDRAASAP